jgi:curved DNA-binding protein CbpA
LKYLLSLPQHFPHPGEMCGAENIRVFSKMINYYNILEIHHEVSTEEIKRSFRTLIKKYHPDIHGQNKSWAESKTKTIIQAYKTLSNSTTREQYDRLYKHRRHTPQPPKPPRKAGTNAKADNLEAQVRILFYNLLNGNPDKAIENYERLLKEASGKDFFMHLNHRDNIDCKFLLAEAYEKLGKYDISIELYEYLLNKGNSAAHRKHLLEETKERMKNIYCRKLARNTSPELALRYYEKVLKLNLYKNENAFIYKKMSECFLKLKEYENALQHLHKALSLKPNLQGINKLKAKLREYIPNFAI